MVFIVYFIIDSSLIKLIDMIFSLLILANQFSYIIKFIYISNIICIANFYIISFMLLVLYYYFYIITFISILAF